MTRPEKDGQPASKEQLHDAFGVLTDWLAAVRTHLHRWDAESVRKRAALQANVADVVMVGVAVLLAVGLVVAAWAGVYTR